MPLQATSGAASQDAFGGNGVAVVPNFIEDVFSTYLYTGNGTSQTITNGIDLSTKGGLVWIKSRTITFYHNLFDTARGVNNRIFTPVSNAQITTADSLTAFNTTGFSVGATAGLNVSDDSLVSWTFRKQPKFFDVVTFTSSASGNKTFSHNLGSTPGCVIIKNTQTSDPWLVYHRSVGNDAYLSLNSTAASDPLVGAFSATSTTFTISSSLMYNSQTYVAYLFAHDAGGFGLTGTDNVISCGSFTSGNPSSTPVTVTLGYEPQWILVKPNNAGNNWAIYDTMRGWTAGTDGDAYLLPNTAGAEGLGNYGGPTATGFIAFNGFNTSTECIYIAIRRGPMKVPTLGTSVFAPLARTGNNTQTSLTGFGFPPDLAWTNRRDGAEGFTSDKLRGPTQYLTSQSTAAEAAYPANNGLISLNQDGVTIGTDNFWNAGTPIANWFFRRAPSFFDVVCYTGTGSTQNVAHNLGVIPSFIVCKRRNGAANWCALAGNSNGTYESLYLNTTVGTLYTAPSAAVAGLTATTFNPQAVFPSEVNGSGETCVAYLFGTVAGVSKVSSYTGTGTTQTINCGFTAGARFVLIKRTDDTGDWYVWDSARGIVAGNDPYLLLNSTAAEVTNTDYIDTASTGFEISSTAPAAINASGGSFIFFAVA